MHYVTDIDAPISQGGEPAVDQSKLEMLLSFGFSEEVARKALKASVIFVHYFTFFLSLSKNVIISILLICSL